MDNTGNEPKSESSEVTAVGGFFHWVPVACRFFPFRSSPPCSYHLCSRMLVPGSLVTSLTLHSHPRSRGERSGSERSEKERNEPREMGCEGSMSVARCGGKDTKGRAATHHLLHSFRGPCPSLPPPLFAPVPYGPFATRGEKDTSGEEGTTEGTG